MQFAYPTWLFALLALPALFGWTLWTGALRRRRLARYAAPEFWPSVAGEASAARRRWRMALRLGALGLLILALARPQWGVKERPLIREGSDLMIALDVSNSMLAADIAPSRLERAKEQIRSLLHHLRGDRVGIVAFAGDAFTQCPLTTDYALAARLLDLVGPHSVGAQGTRIGAALDTALAAFERAGQGDQAILLVTDGEDHEGKALEAARRAAERGVIIMCVGIGGEEGAPIRLASGDYKSDAQGHKVTTRLDAATLAEIARVTGGKAVVTDRTGQMNLESLYEQIHTLRKSEVESLDVILMEDRFQWPLALAIALLLAELALGERRLRAREWIAAWGELAARPKKSQSAEGKRGAAAAAAVLLAAAALCAWPAGAQAEWFDFGNEAARACEEGNRLYFEKEYEKAMGRYLDAAAERPGQAALDINSGLALARLGRLDEARRAFEQAARREGAADPKLRARALYNAALAAQTQAMRQVEQREFQPALENTAYAIDQFSRAKELDPESAAASQNLDISRRWLNQIYQAMTQPTPPPPPESSPQEGDSEKKEEGGNSQQSSASRQDSESEDSEKDASSSQPQTNPSESTSNSGDTKEESEQRQTQKSQADLEKKKEEREGGQCSAECAAKHPGEPCPAASKARPEEMSPEDALRLLATLGDENSDCLERCLRCAPGAVRYEKDW